MSSCGAALQRRLSAFPAAGRLSGARRVVAGAAGRRAEAEAATRDWVERVIVGGPRLCPFAEQPVRAGAVRVVVSAADTEAELWDDFADEVSLLLSAPESEVATTLLAVGTEGLLQGFEEWLGFVAEVEGRLEEAELLDTELQLIAFHPEHRFGGLREDDPVHFEKRAPFPTLNLLRASMVDAVGGGSSEAASDATESVAEHNERVLRDAGTGALRALFDSLGRARDTPA